MLFDYLFEPLDALFDPLPTQPMRILYFPPPPTTILQAQQLNNLHQRHHLPRLELIRIDQHRQPIQQLMIHHLLKLIMDSPHIIPMRCINHIDQSVLILEVVLPEAPDGHLPANIPNGDVATVEIDLLHVKAVCGGGFDELGEF